MLAVDGAIDSKGRVELFERGYGKDAAGIAREAIAYGTCDFFNPQATQLISPFIAKENDFDVVLIDTAGRMQDNEVTTPPFSRSLLQIAHLIICPLSKPLMRALAKVSSLHAVYQEHDTIMPPLIVGSGQYP